MRFSGRSPDAVEDVLADVEDAFAIADAGDFTAAIDWGDGTTSAGTVTGGAGSFTVSSSHTYADEGSFTVKATLTDDAPGSATATASNTATVAETDVLTTAASQPTIAAIEGNSFSGAVAVFNDSNNANVAGDFTAAIDWGDGTTTAGTVSGGSGAFTASGSHTYAEDGSFTVSVTLADDAPGTAAATAKVTATISEAALVATGVTVNGFELAPLTSATVATFTHSGAAEPAANFTATINWGDGTASAGTITLSGTTYTVQASHTYTDERTFAVSVNVTDDTAAATANTSAVILEELLPNGQIEHIGATSMPDGITKGDVDINIRVSPNEFPRTVETLRGLFPVAQPDNWTESFASFSDTSKVCSK